MSAAPEPRIYTEEEYLILDELSHERYEFMGGRIYFRGGVPIENAAFGMSGASEPHNLIMGNVFATLRGATRGRGCRAYAADMRVRMGANGEHSYPDVTALCGRPELEKRRGDTLLNPSLVVEVLSPSTEAYDRGDKFTQYARIPTLREYLLVAQDRVHVERYTPGASGAPWECTVYDHLDAAVDVPSLGAVLPLRDVYADVDFPEHPRPRVVREGEPDAAYAGSPAADA